MTPNEILDGLMCDQEYVCAEWLWEEFTGTSEQAALFLKALNAADSINHGGGETVLRDKCVAAMRELARMFRGDFAEVAARKAEELAE
jgi:enhancing lycopene biosynthesis protein 2